MTATGGIAGYRWEGEARPGRLGPVRRAVRLRDGARVVVHLVTVPLSDRMRQAAVAELGALTALGPLPHVVPVLDAGVDPTGQPYLVTPWTAGGSLADRLERTGPLPPSAVLTAVTAAATGLSALHAAGHLHGRVTPGNLLVGIGDAVAVTGALVPALAAAVPADGPYTPPELLSGGDPSAAGDTYALAATAFTLLEGVAPHGGGPKATLRVLAGPVAEATHAPPSVRTVLRRGLAVEPAARYPTPAAFAEALAAAEEADRSSTSPVPGGQLDTLPPTVPPPPAPGSGRPLGSGYLLDAPIGRGATGAVWRGRRRVDGSPVAVKLLLAEYAEDAETVTRFLRERTVLVGLTHPHLVDVVDLVAEGETLAIVMELVHGDDLRREARRTPLGRTEACEVLAQVSEALAVVHAAGIVHRDLKPENVLVERRTPTPSVKLTDFGVARAAEGPTLTRPTKALGTPAYIAPELVAGRVPAPPVDVYSLGVMAYELFARRRPFEAPTTEGLLRAHLDAEPPRPPAVDDDVWAVVRGCLEKDPARRPSARQLAHAFAALARGAAVSPWASATLVPAGGGPPPAHRAADGQGGPGAPEGDAPTPWPSLDHLDHWGGPPAPGTTGGTPTGPGDVPGGRPVPDGGGPTPLSALGPLLTTAASRPVPAAPPKPVPRRRRWWPLAAAAVLVVVVGAVAGFWTAQPDRSGRTPPRTASSSPAGPRPQAVYVPVQVTSPAPGVLRLTYSGGRRMSGFQSYTIFLDGAPVDNGIQAEVHVIPGLDRTVRHCVLVAALVETAQPTSATPQPPTCLVADGKST